MSHVSDLQTAGPPLQKDYRAVTVRFSLEDHQKLMQHTELIGCSITAFVRAAIHDALEALEHESQTEQGE